MTLFGIRGAALPTARIWVRVGVGVAIGIGIGPFHGGFDTDADSDADEGCGLLVQPIGPRLFPIVLLLVLVVILVLGCLFGDLPRVHQTWGRSNSRA